MFILTCVFLFIFIHVWPCRHLNFLICYFNRSHFFSLNIIRKFHYQLSWLLLSLLLKFPVNLFSWFSTTTSAAVSHFLLYICDFLLCFVMFCIYFWNVLRIFGASHEWVRHRFSSYHTCHSSLVIYYHQYSSLIFILSIFI